MTERSLDLLNDILKLVRKYGVAEFEHLAAMLSDDQARDQALAVLRGVAKVAEESGARSGAARHVPDAEPKRAELAALARARIGDLECYPHLRDLVDELARLGLRVPPSGFRKREDAMRAVSRHLTEVTIEAAQAFVDQLRSGPQRSGLEEWSKIIMERKP